MRGITSSDYVSLADYIRTAKQMPTIIVTPVFKFEPGKEPVFVGLWRDGEGRDYAWENLPANSIFAAAEKGDTT